MKKQAMVRQGNVWFAAFLAALFLFAVATPLPAIAGIPPTGNAAFDEEVHLLSELKTVDDYGDTIINWIAYGNPQGESGASLLSHLAFTMSAISLVVMAALAALGAANYTIHTANRGQPGGQIISSFWMPLRIATAMILLVPLPGGNGYSTLHMGVIEIAKMGGAHGSLLAGKALDYIGTKGVYTPTTPGGGTAVIHGLVMGEVCSQYVNANERRSPGDMGSVTMVKTHNGLSFDKSRRVLSSQKGYCGSVTFPNGASYSSDAYIAAGQVTASESGITTDRVGYYVDMSTQVSGLTTELVNLAASMQPKAAAIASKLLSDQGALDKLKRSGKSAQSGFESANQSANAAAPGYAGEINELVEQYNAAALEIIISRINKVQEGFASRDGTGTWTDEVKKAGWPAFGMVFWHASQMQKQINRLYSEFYPATSEPLGMDNYDKDERYNLVLARYDVVSSAATDTSTAFEPTLDSLLTAGDMDGGRLVARFQRYVSNFFKRLILPTSDDANMVTRLQATGYAMMATVEGAFLGSSVAKGVIYGFKVSANEAIDGVTQSASGIPFLGRILGGLAKSTAGAATKGMLAGVTTTAIDLFSYFRYLLVPILIGGFVLGVMLPAIPAMFWLLGIISYMLFFVQCLLVSTFWLAAHGTAEGQGWGTEHTRQGYLLMLGLFLSPVLRVAGFAAMLLVLMPVGILAHWMFNYMFGVASQHGVITPLFFIGSFAVTVIFAYSACVRIFALPSELFELGLRWINGGQEVTGDSNAEGASRTMIAAFVHRTATPTPGVPSSQMMGGGGSNPMREARGAAPTPTPSA